MAPGTMTGGFNATGPRRWLIFLFLFLLYNANFRVIRHDDTLPTRLLPFSILIDHTLSLDRWIPPYLGAARGVYGVYFATRARGHWMSAYPIALPLFVTPLYVPAARWLSQQHPRPAANDVVVSALIDLMEKLSASLIAALSAVILYSALRAVATVSLSLFVTLVYAIASNTWTISSQALWRHGLTELSFALLLWALLAAGESSRPAWAGFALALAAANKPADATLALVFLLYFAGRGPKELARFLAALLVIGALVISYNYYYFGRLFGAYPNPFVKGPPSPVVPTPFWQSILGLLVSPNRGLFIFTPWTLLALAGAVWMWRQAAWGWSRHLIVGMAAIFLEQAKLGDWWGGWSFGPRYLTDLLPFFALFLAVAWEWIGRTNLRRAVLGVAVAASLAVQMVGAFYYPRGGWDGIPISVDRDTRRLWDWRDTQIGRSFRAGPASPQLYYNLFLLFHLEKPGQPLKQPDSH